MTAEELKAKLEPYLLRRIRELSDKGWTTDMIMQQLEAVATSKRELRELIQKVLQ